MAIALAVAALASGAAHAASGLDVAIGLGGRAVSGLPVPLRASGDGLPQGPARLRVVQTTDDRWMAGAILSYETPVVVSESGTCEETVLVYDTAFPLRVELWTTDGQPLAEAQIALRPLARESPFPICVGDFAVRPPEPFVFLAPDELPRDWAGLSSAESVWIGRVPGGLAANQWDAVARWTLSGGSLVVFTGSDFPLLDAPRLRDLLPIRDPRVDAGAGGVLTGVLRAGSVVRETKGESPWIVSRRYGLGAVTLVATSAGSLDGSELDEVRGLVKPAQFLSRVGAASDLLDAQVVDRPDLKVAVLLVGLCVIALPALAARRKRTSLIFLIGVFGLLAALAQVYAARNTASDIYQTNVTLRLGGSLGLSVLASASVGMGQAPVSVPVSVVGPSFEILPPGAWSGAYRVSVTDGTARMELVPGGRRILTAYQDEPPLGRAKLVPGQRMLLTDGLPDAMEHATLLLDGEAVALSSPVPGDEGWQVMSFLDPEDPGSRTPGAASDAFLEVVRRSLPLAEGAWLVGGERTTAVSKAAGARIRWTDVALYVVEVERD